MAQITTQEVEYVARLALLGLNKDEKEEFTHQLDAILGYVAKINELDTTNILPTSHPLSLSNVMRKDKVEKSLTIEDVLANAPQQEKGFFKVPRIIS